MNYNLNCLSFWFPRIQAAGVPVPETRIVTTDIPLIGLCDGQKPSGVDPFLAEMQSACESLPGPPWFLRTGQGSGKHLWSECCYLTDTADLVSHIAMLVEWSYMVDMRGLPVNVWAVREFLPTEPLCILPRYSDMPVTREWRMFVRNGRLQCLHPYWLKDSLRQGMREPVNEDSLHALYESLCRIDKDWINTCRDFAERVGWSVCSDWPYWSVDILETQRGAYVTDMALGEESYHWEECKYADQ